MPSRPSPKVLLIDIGDVVIWDPRPRIVREIVRREHLDPDLVHPVYYRTAHRLALGAIGLREAYAHLRASLRWTLSYPKFHELVASQSLVAVPGILPSLRDLRRRRTVRIVFASNTERITWEGLRRKFHLDEYADAAALSYRLRTMKPGRRFYRAALRIARAPANETLFLDNLAANVRGARALGIPSRTVRSPRDTLRVLRALARGAAPGGTTAAGGGRSADRLNRCTRATGAARASSVPLPR